MAEPASGEMENGIAQHLDIEFRNLHYSVKSIKAKEEKHILRGVNGQFRCGFLTAILGPSGAGKTSLLNIISGFRTSGVTGSIKVNGNERNMEEFRQLSCYIPQDFSMFPQLTTRETIMFAADFKLEVGVSKHEKKALVDKILELVGLNKSQKTSVEKLSGGEKKRLSIGVELITNPPVMFFDEPTSGLDSSSSLQVISHLKSLAKGGRTVVCTIHQPSSRIFEMFDDLYILSEGQCLYNGPINEMTSMFQEEGFECPEHYNRADFALEIASRNHDDGIEKLITKYSNDSQFIPSDSHKDIRSNAVSFPSSKLSWFKSKPLYKTSPLMQFWTLVKRSMLCTFRDMYTTRVRVLTHIFVGLILGALCYQVGNEAKKVYTNVAYVFFFLMFLFFINPTLTVLTFPTEAEIVGREHLNCWYGVPAYYFSKIVAEFPVQVLCPTLFMVSSYFLSDQPLEGPRIIRLWTMCIILAILGQLIGYVFGAAFGAQLGVYLVGVLQNPMVLLSGFLVRLRDIPSYVSWLTPISYYRFAFQAAMQSIYGFDRADLACTQPYCRFKSPKNILEEFDIKGDTYATDMLYLGIWIFGFLIILYIVLLWRLRISA